MNKKVMSLLIALVFALTVITPVFADKPDKTNVNVNVNAKSLKAFIFNDSTQVQWAQKAIEKLGAKGVFAVNSQKHFNPKAPVTNLEAIAMIVRISGKEDLAKASTTQNVLLKGKKFVWGIGYMNVAVEKGIILPEELKSFNPNAPAKRHEVAKYLVRALGMEKDAQKNMDAELTFKDADAVPADSVGYVYVANKEGFITGSDKGLFQPMKPISRAEMAVILDRVDGTVDDPVVDKYEKKVIFDSVDKTDKEIRVKTSDGSYVTYSYVENVPVYKNKEYIDVTDLVKGDGLYLVFNKDKKIIFIEVKKVAVEEDETEAVSVPFSTVKTLSDTLEKYVDSWKKRADYKAFATYDNDSNKNLYFFVSRGEKSTGGYSVDVKSVSKYTEDGKLNIKVVVETEDPAKDDIVSQSVTYPYDLVKTDSFISNVNYVFFYDEDGKLLEKEAVASIKDIDADNDADEVSGVITKIVSGTDKNTLTVKVKSLTKTYEVAKDAEIELDGKTVEFGALKVGSKVEMKLVDGVVTEIEATSEDEDTDAAIEVSGTITTIISDATKNKLVVKVDNTLKTYEVAKDASIELNDKTVEFGALKVGSEVEMKVVDGIVTEIEAEFED